MTPAPDLDPHCASFVAASRDMPARELADTIRTACLRGLGHWQDPSPGGPIGRPATHLFEIAFYGVTASGTTAEEAARNWRRCALTLTKD
ncbi:MAG: hypothetical protein ACK4MS_10550 [Paracoccaceae bacterium]